MNFFSSEFCENKNFNNDTTISSLFFAISFFFFFLLGHCHDSSSGQPPRGLQFTLGTNSTPVLVDTIVMANLVSIYILVSMNLSGMFHL